MGFVSMKDVMCVARHGGGVLLKGTPRTGQNLPR
jgi:hypothetical protein